METINVTSANVHEQSILDRNSHIRMIQEHCMNSQQLKQLEAKAKLAHMDLIVGPTDPEQQAQHAGWC